MCRTEEGDDVIGDEAAVVHLAARQAVHHRLLQLGPRRRPGRALAALAAALDLDAVDELWGIRLLREPR